MVVSYRRNGDYSKQFEWTYELNEDLCRSSYTFAITVITPIVGTIGWTIADIEQLDIKTRNKLSLTGNLHPNSDNGKLYISRTKGGRGLKNIKTLFESRLIAIYQHWKLNSVRNQILKYVNEREEESMIRVGTNKY